MVAVISEEKDRQIIDIRVHNKTKNGELTPTKKGVEIPVSMLPEVRRMVNLLEEAVTAKGLSDEFDNLHDLKVVREIVFAHPSEEEFAKILKFYHIEWQYEPKTFPVKWDDSGNVIESFTPDFFLPDLNLYIELTTMKQSLVTKKNRKVKLLKKLYPEINIKLLYGKDYKSLLRKYEQGDKKIP